MQRCGYYYSVERLLFRRYVDPDGQTRNHEWDIMPGSDGIDYFVIGK